MLEVERGFVQLEMGNDTRVLIEGPAEIELRGEALVRMQRGRLVARAFGLAFRVDDETVEQYDEFGIDLEDASGRSHQLLPVPAVYLIDREGVIRFAHWDADYRERLSAEALIEAAEAMVASMHNVQ